MFDLKILQSEDLLKKNLVIQHCNDNERKELYEIFLEVIKEGDSYPHLLPFSYDDFLNYFFHKESKVLICKSNNEVIGGFYIRPNFPGKSSHIANCGYLVKKSYRGQQIGFHLGKCSIDIAKQLGYMSMIFNLVFKENTAAVKLWEKLGFKIICTLKNAVRKSNNEFQDAYIMSLNLEE